MPRTIEPCAWCGGQRPRGLRRRMTDPTTRKSLRIACCFSCKGVPGLAVPEAWRNGIKRGPAVPAGDQDAYRTWADKHRLLVQDARTAIPEVSGVALWFTDPPYNINFEYEGVPDNLPWKDYEVLLRDVASKTFRAARRDASFVLVHYPETAARLVPSFEAGGWRLHQWTTWIYRSKRGAKGRRFSRSSRAVLWFTKGRPDFQDPDPDRSLDWVEVDQVRGGSLGWEGYGCQIPAGLLRHWIQALTKPGDLVADPFLGTASTAKEAVFLERYAWGCDVNQRAEAYWAPLKRSGPGPDGNGPSTDGFRALEPGETVPVLQAVRTDPAPVEAETVHASGNGPPQAEATRSAIKAGLRTPRKHRVWMEAGALAHGRCHCPVCRCGEVLFVGTSESDAEVCQTCQGGQHIAPKDGLAITQFAAGPHIDKFGALLDETSLIRIAENPQAYRQYLERINNRRREIALPPIPVPGSRETVPAGTGPPIVNGPDIGGPHHV